MYAGVEIPDVMGVEGEDKVLGDVAREERRANKGNRPGITLCFFKPYSCR